ncbi:MAG TPA: hypothetical protein VFY84_17520 [Jiangellales bacterium]|nr:hypothetical protein [Jiangellales bacterium]
MGDIKALLRDARLPERTVELCLRGDLVAEYEAVEAEHARAVDNRGNSLSAGVETAQLRERLDGLREQMAASNVTFRLRALSRPEFRRLVAQHPPRRDGDEVNERDNNVGINTETFFDALVRASVVEPQLDDEDWDLLLGERLTDRQFDLLAGAAWALNKRDVDIPFSFAGSQTPT